MATNYYTVFNSLLSALLWKKSTQTSENQRAELWAVLVGVNYYIPGDARSDENGEHLEYPSLHGPVQDVLLVEQYLLQSYRTQKSHIIKLVATELPDSGQNASEESEVNRPTYPNIKRVLEEVKNKAKPHDFVYFHYSGHGARVKTVYPKLKGKNGFDEALAPTDINCGGRYLRDAEIEVLLKKMVEKKLIVTVVLDSCHAGGAVRGVGVPVTRGLGKADFSELDTDKPAVTQEELDFLLGRYRTRSGHKREGWLLEPHGFTLLAACRQHEKAHEIYRNGDWYGAFTYWLIDTLKSSNGSFTHRMLCDRASEKVQREFGQQQTPVSVGTVERLFLELESRQSISSFAITGFKDPVKTRDVVTLKAGRAHGVREDDIYAIFPWDVQDPSDSGRLARIRVTAVDHLTSKAEFTEVRTSDVQKIETGCRAILRERQEKIRLRFSGECQQVRRQFVSSLEKYQNSVVPMEMVPDSHTSKVSFHISVLGENRYRLLDGEGKDIPNLPIASTPDALLEQTAHVAQFQLIRGLKSDSTASPKQDEFIFEIKLNGLLISHAKVEHEGIVEVLFQNNSEEILNLTVLNLQPLWGITHIYPPGRDYETIDPRESKLFKLKMTLPEGASSHTMSDTLKAFVTPEPTSFAALQMGGMKEDGTFPKTRAVGQLASLLQKLGVPRRNATIVIDSTQKLWETKEISIDTIRTLSIGISKDKGSVD